MDYVRPGEDADYVDFLKCYKKASQADLEKDFERAEKE